MKQPLPMTEKEKIVLEFIENEMAQTGVSPSYQEIKDHFGFASFNSVQNYLKQLSNKGYIQIANNQKRAIQILHSSLAVQETLQAKVSALKSAAQNSPSKSGSPRSSFLRSPGGHGEILTLPLLGKVAAGSPIEAFEHDEFIQVPPDMVRNPSKSYALKVSGSSMIEDGIFDGDLILVQKQASASNGEIVVASIDNESTVKRFFSPKGPEKKIELRPANSTMQSMWYEPDQVDIQGVVVGLIRRF